MADPTKILTKLKNYILVDGFPMVFDLERSHGAHFYNAYDGKTYLDCFSFFATLPLGYNHPKLDDEAYQSKLLKAAQIKVSNPDVYTQEYLEFVEIFAQIASRPPFKHFFFIEGGSLAVENALKVAFDWKVRKNIANGRPDSLGQKVIYFKDAFHGRSGYTLSMTNTFDPNKTKYFPKFPWIRVTNPGLHFENPEQLEIQSIQEIKAAFQNNPHDIACVIIEPIQSEGGDNHFSSRFLSTLRQLCDENEALLIFDEVQTGIGLTGKMWAYEHFGVTPDIVAFGKKTQVCGIMATTRIDDVDNCFKVSSRINSTFGGNLVDMVRATRYLEIIQQDKVIDHVEHMGKFLLDQLTQIAKSNSIISNVRGRGFLTAFDLPNTEMRNSFRKTLFENGVLALNCGSRSIRIRPVLDFSKENVLEFVSLVEKSLKGIKLK